ncbi:hypothetical protein GQ53DRAFT_839571 [Thozetella sp. PMI_491]|nr:hypothetical protein GQ53DRAFT_839571 [Thozetella sp. PMI_491]
MTGRHGRRSKNGCFTCRARHVKCPMEKPICRTCRKFRFSCEWPAAAPSDPSAQPPEASQGGCPKQTQLVPLQPNQSRPVNHPPCHIPPVLSSLDIPCGNSLLLSYRDKLWLNYFTSSAVYCFHTNGSSWSSFQYIYERMARSNSFVMRMILALSASEMHNRGYDIGCESPDSGSLDPGLQHYDLAIQEFSTWLGQKGALESQLGLEVFLNTIFFLIQYELQFPSRRENPTTHLEGLWSLVNTHSTVIKGNTRKGHNNSDADSVSCLSSIILIWILYADMSGISTGTCTSIVDRFLNSPNPVLHPDRLWTNARVGLHRIWGELYPSSQQEEDMKVYRPLELAHRLQFIRFKIWNARQTQDSAGLETESALLREELVDLGGEYHDVLALAVEVCSKLPNSAAETICTMSSGYWACVLFHHRMFGKLGPLDNVQCNAMKNIIAVAYSYYKRDRRRLVRLTYPLFMAAIETSDAIHKDWLLERLGENRVLQGEYEWAARVAGEITTIQDRPNSGWVDLALFMQRS